MGSEMCIRDRFCTTTVTLKNTTATKHLTRGVPQGGILSPVAWNIAFESFLENFQTVSVKVTGIADDAALIVPTRMFFVSSCRKRLTKPSRGVSPIN